MIRALLGGAEVKGKKKQKGKAAMKAAEKEAEALH